MSAGKAPHDGFRLDHSFSETSLGKCPVCGSTNIVINDEGFAVCADCGYTFDNAIESMYFLSGPVYDNVVGAIRFMNGEPVRPEYNEPSDTYDVKGIFGSRKHYRLAFATKFTDSRVIFKLLYAEIFKQLDINTYSRHVSKLLEPYVARMTEKLVDRLINKCKIKKLAINQKRAIADELVALAPRHMYLIARSKPNGARIHTFNATNRCIKEAIEDALTHVNSLIDRDTALRIVKPQLFHLLEPKPPLRLLGVVNDLLDAAAEALIEAWRYMGSHTPRLIRYYFRLIPAINTLVDMSRNSGTVILNDKMSGLAKAYMKSLRASESLLSARLGYSGAAALTLASVGKNPLARATVPRVIADLVSESAPPITYIHVTKKVSMQRGRVLVKVGLPLGTVLLGKETMSWDVSDMLKDKVTIDTPNISAAMRDVIERMPTVSLKAIVLGSITFVEILKALNESGIDMVTRTRDINANVRYLEKLGLYDAVPKHLMERIEEIASGIRNEVRNEKTVRTLRVLSTEFYILASRRSS